MSLSHLITRIPLPSPCLQLHGEVQWGVQRQGSPLRGQSWGRSTPLGAMQAARPQMAAVCCCGKCCGPACSAALTWPRLSLPVTLVLRSEEEFARGRAVALKQTGIQADGSQPCLQAVTPAQQAPQPRREHPALNWPVPLLWEHTPPPQCSPGPQAPAPLSEGWHEQPARLGYLSPLLLTLGPGQAPCLHRGCLWAHPQGNPLLMARRDGCFPASPCRSRAYRQC